MYIHLLAMTDSVLCDSLLDLNQVQIQLSVKAPTALRAAVI